MTNETRERIKYYKDKLPHMKEKLAAAIMMLVVAACVTVTATYAWTTLSTAPEITNIDTTVAANGSLEIALATGEGTVPGKSAVGDSSATEGMSSVTANDKWGNLVNLSDPFYGLNNITLRPAALNGKTGLLTNPLYGVKYGEDGRVSDISSEDYFAYMYYDTTSSAFLKDENNSHLGVRAVSSVKYVNLQGDSQLQELKDKVSSRKKSAQENYELMIDQSDEPGISYMNSIQALIEKYANNVIASKAENTIEVTLSIENLYKMAVHFRDKIMIPAGESYLYMADMIALMKTGVADCGYTVEKLAEATVNNSLHSYLTTTVKNEKGEDVVVPLLSGLKTFAEDYIELNKVLKDSEKGDFSEKEFTSTVKKNSLAYWNYYVTKMSGKVYFSDIRNIIDWLCCIDKARLNDVYVNELLDDYSRAAGILSAKSHVAKLEDGAIKRMEQRIGFKMGTDSEYPKIKVTLNIQRIKDKLGFLGSLLDDEMLFDNVALTTNAAAPYEIDTALNDVVGMNTGAFVGGDAVAEDTYAMAIDLWVRTNAGSDGQDKIEVKNENTENVEITETIVTSAPKAYLTLEGAVVMGQEEQQVYIEDIYGEKQPAYTATFAVEGEEQTATVYKRLGTYYYIESEQEIVFEDKLVELYGELPTVNYVQQISVQDVITGYEGVNRVWTNDQLAGYNDVNSENELIAGTSTTQGGGSCYVFYAEDLEEQSRFLELLKSMKVAFVDGQGDLKAVAYMDTEHRVEENGKVTVPLELEANSAIDLGTEYAIMPLTKNAATRLTALIYLEGTKLTNEMVLANGTIQGNLNIQFGSHIVSKVSTTTENKEGEITSTTNKVEYKPEKDSVAIEKDDVMSQVITATATVSRTSWNYGDVDGSGNPLTTDLEVRIEGVEPSKVSARFMRAISNTQGTAQDELVLVPVVSAEGTKTGKWNVTCNFNKPGKYVLRSVQIDGVDYDLEESVTVTIQGSSITSVRCDDIKDSSREATIMKSASSYSTNVYLEFGTSNMEVTSVNGIMRDESGRQINIPFTVDGDGKWSGTATFATSGTYTLEVVEINGDPYPLSSSQKFSLEVLLGLKTRIWITAEDDTIEKLRETYTEATATKFMLTDDVELQVSAEIYDNLNNEITALSNVKLYYGLAGSIITNDGVDSDLRWDTATGKYVGKFDISDAATYSFALISIDQDIDKQIEKYTSAPMIYAMPPEDAYYFGNYTDAYQYAPNGEAVMNVGIAYSSSASRVVATMYNEELQKEYEVTATSENMGAKVENEENISVNLWKFPIPKVTSSGVEDSKNGTQDGNWKLTGLKLFGVFYNDVFYPDTETATGVSISLEKDGEEASDIDTKVVQTLNVAVSSASTAENRSFTGTFMADHNVNDVTVKITDFENKALDSKEAVIQNVKLKYYLNYNSNYATTYGYTADNMSGVHIANERVGSSTDNSNFNNFGLNFIYAGEYNKCDVDYEVCRVTELTDETTGEITTELGAAKPYTKTVTNVPVYKVYWTAPTITITGTNPKGSTADNMSGGDDVTYDVDISNISDLKYFKTKNYYEADYANVHRNYWSYIADRGYTLPKVTLVLSDAGGKFSEAEFSYKFGTNNQHINSVKFAQNKLTNNLEVGKLDSSDDMITYSVGEGVKTKTIDLSYAGRIYHVILSKPITIRQVEEAPVTITYNIPTDYASFFEAPSSYTCYDGKNEITLRDLEDVRHDLIKNLGVVSGEEPEERYPSSNAVAYYYETSSSKYGVETYTYYPYTKNVCTWTVVSSTETYERYYRLAGWNIGGEKKSAEETIRLTGNMTATAIINEDISQNYIAKENKATTYTTTLYTAGTVTTETVGWFDKKDEMPAGTKTTEDQGIINELFDKGTLEVIAEPVYSTISN